MAIMIRKRARTLSRYTKKKNFFSAKKPGLTGISSIILYIYSIYKIYIIYVNKALGCALTRRWSPDPTRGKTYFIRGHSIGNCVGQNDIGTCFSVRTLTSICQSHSTNDKYHFVAFLNFRVI